MPAEPSTAPIASHFRQDRWLTSNNRREALEGVLELAGRRKLGLQRCPSGGESLCAERKRKFASVSTNRSVLPGSTRSRIVLSPNRSSATLQRKGKCETSGQ